MDLRGKKGVPERRKEIEKLLDIKLENVGSFYPDGKTACKRNCENMIGIAQIPMGVAGPLMVDREDFYIPLATTEGALVASVNRGCKAITKSGGCKVRIEKVGVTRGPVFEVKNIAEAVKLENFLKNNYSKIKKIISKTDKHLKLTDYKTQNFGKNFYVRFIFDSDYAMGMNMATIATQAVAKFIEIKTGIGCVSISGNFCADKKPSWLNFVEGRGYKIWAEVTVDKNIVKNVLKTTPSKIYDVWLAKCLEGSIASGSLGFNAQFANIVAAFFIATGQDPAHVVEGSLGITSVRVVKDGLYISIYVPDVMLGTIGGGTGLATQKEALSIVKVKNPEELAKVLGGAVLAGEISLLASLSEGTLGRAHKALGRGETK